MKKLEKLTIKELKDLKERMTILYEKANNEYLNQLHYELIEYGWHENGNSVFLQSTLSYYKYKLLKINKILEEKEIQKLKNSNLEELKDLRDEVSNRLNKINEIIKEKEKEITKQGDNIWIG